MHKSDEHAECRRPLFTPGVTMFLLGVLMAFAAGMAAGTSLDLFAIATRG